MVNKYDSPIFYILRVSIIYGIFDLVINMVLKGHFFSKKDWRKIVWQRAWEIEDEDWLFRAALHPSLNNLNKIIGKPLYLVWWQVSDVVPSLIRCCETMSKILCGASKLKCHDQTLRRATFLSRKCTLCNEHAIEDIEHLVMNCGYHAVTRTEMFNEIYNIENGIGRDILEIGDS